MIQTGFSSSLLLVRRSYDTNPEVNSYSEEQERNSNAEQTNANSETGETNSPDYSQVEQPTEEEIERARGLGAPILPG
jgi:hypothetical protein